ncbi:hypothetical protein [Acidipropionibacterium jensenii]|uniref:hypothetical protein n=1 Tax=Acidipropionibacterium jensenii TaxID=1749 RepID=UPI002649C8BC|nr:hypothetical protein [Acidipropionibacterium jensenii]MDN6556541.1 hypothetical protein [Acidipropionibacterium acidipropionici]MDN5978292.1 hypothetical protein [Acidipropionibacterium jensenii]MDN5997342.1 hypothetical protein [Acidipropionibacterium jensenii]MDN6427938.1 hypothetical protein [Acidipropionibacterium jensenii]MDN6442658.1 hypothetical protein [Acidipropionibacterium jensenii]
MSRNLNGTPARKTAGLGDIRVIIGGLIGIYGAILTVMGITGSVADRANLWTGIGLLAACGIFLLWDHVAPTYIDEPETVPEGATGEVTDQLG